MALPEVGPALSAWVRRDDATVHAQITYSAWNQPVVVSIPAQDQVSALATPAQ